MIKKGCMKNHFSIGWYSSWRGRRQGSGRVHGVVKSLHQGACLWQELWRCQGALGAGRQRRARRRLTLGGIVWQKRPVQFTWSVRQGGSHTAETVSREPEVSWWTLDSSFQPRKYTDVSTGLVSCALGAGGGGRGGSHPWTSPRQWSWAVACWLESIVVCFLREDDLKTFQY